MKKKLLAVAIAALFGRSTIRRGRADARDVAFLGRMGAGSPGEVNRTHPASIEPALIGTVAPTGYGMAVTPDAANGLRMFQAGDTALTNAWGFVVRPYPTQQTSGGMNASFGAGTPPASGVQDVMRSGYMTVQLNDITAVVKKGDPVFIECAVTAGIHVQGGFEVLASGTTAALDANKYAFNGPCDVNGVVEISVNP